MKESEIRRVILNGDDFGYSQGVNKGIIESIEKGILTSTSVMVNRKFAFDAKKIPTSKDISVGLHLDLTEEGLQRWSKILYILTWPEKKIREAFDQQINKFVDIRGKLPDHIDSHHHIHRLTGFKKIVSEFSSKYKIPVRGVDATFEVDFYGRSFSHWNDLHGVSPEKLINVLQNLPPGIHEIMCHPGYLDQGLKDTRTTYLKQREKEIQALTNQKVAKFVKDNEATIKLISWKNIKN